MKKLGLVIGEGGDQFIKELAELGVSSRLYYPCLHSQGVFANVSKQTDAQFPNSVEFAETALSLPIYPQMSDEEVEYVIKSVKQTLLNNEKKR